MASTVQTVNAAVLYPGTGRELRVEERDIWPPKPHEAQIEVLATGLCGSDRASSSSFSYLTLLTLSRSPLLLTWPQW
jgi:D-arabinose 1-dehydrogenase-like Zn-dependent alcohol dehydrogenase